MSAPFCCEPFFGMRICMQPRGRAHTQTEGHSNPRPPAKVLTVKKGGAASSFEPQQNGEVIRFYTAKKLGMSMGACVRLQ